jgi:hypothetical protein
MKDIEKINRKDVYEATKKAYEALPEYFHKVPASSSGKYHPRFSLGEGGLIRHTKFAVDMALELFKLFVFSDSDQDCIISALILHDGLKHGIDYAEYCISDHDEVMANWLEIFWKEEKFGGKNVIIECIRTHMGQWSSTRKPESKIEEFVHLCDYIASRRFIDNYYSEVKNEQVSF